MSVAPRTGPSPDAPATARNGGDGQRRERTPDHPASSYAARVDGLTPPAAPAPSPPVMKPAAQPANGRRRLTSIIIFAAVVLIGVAIGAWYYISGLGFEQTDDAFIDADIAQVSSKVAGRLTNVLAQSNAMVQAGDLLAEIDPADYQASVDRAQAAVALANAQHKSAQIDVEIIDATTSAAVAQADAELQAAEAQVLQEQAQLEAAKADLDRAKADFERYSQLSDKAVSQQRLDVARAAATSAESNMHAVEKRVAWAQAQVAASQSKRASSQADRQRVEAAKSEVARREAEVRQADAMLRAAQLELSYTKIFAPSAGRVTNKSALAGDYVEPGRVLMALVSPDVYVTANFKETQLRHMRPGQHATIHIDAYKLDLPGHIESIQSGAGAAFSLLPPQNATGNYVKVVQRVPVKIVFDQPPDTARYALGPGMSVVPHVEVDR